MVAESSADISAGAFKFCMYGKSGGFASKPSSQTKISTHQNLIFLSLRAQGWIEVRDYENGVLIL
jgi:hypothetical protein